MEIRLFHSLKVSVITEMVMKLQINRKWIFRHVKC